MAKVFEFALAAFEACAVVVANDVGEHGFFHCALKANKVIEAFVAFGMFWSFPTWNHHRKLVSHSDRVEHLVLRHTRVHVQAGESDFCRGCVEVFKLKFARIATVHGVSPFGTEFFHIEVVCAHTDFLVGVERDANVAVLDFGVCLEVFNGADNFSDASLVVGTEQCVAVGHHEVLTHEVGHFGELLRVEHDAFFLVEHHLAAFIFHHTRIHTVAAHVGCGVEVCDKTDGWHLLVGV